MNHQLFTRQTYSIKLIHLMIITLLTLLVFFSGCSKKVEPVESTTVATEATQETVDTTPVVESEPKAAEPAKVEPVELTIFAAASLTDVTKAIAKSYSKVAPHIKLTFSYGSAGTLQTQIEEGAPGDVFLSAGKKQMDALDEKSLLLPDTYVELLGNKLVLITPKSSDLTLTSFEDVATDAVSMIGIGDPASVPVGQYATDVFTSLGILDKVQAKANYATDVKQVLTWVETAELECGVVYATDAANNDKVVIQCEAPEGSHKPIIYPGAVIGSSLHPEEAKAFLDYLSTEEASGIFTSFGFSIK